MAAAADEPAAKMVKQEDYTKTKPKLFELFKKKQVHISRRRLNIDGLYVYARISNYSFLSLTLYADKTCRNGFVFHKEETCNNYIFEFFREFFDVKDDDKHHSGAFNKVMAFITHELPKMKIYGDELVMAKEYTLKKAMEKEYNEDNRNHQQCKSCGQVNDTNFMHYSKQDLGACLRCWVNEYPGCRGGKTTMKYDKDTYEFDRLGSRKMTKDYEEGLMVSYCGCFED